MAARPLAEYCVGDGATMQDAIAVIQLNESRCCVIRNAELKVIGVFSEGDVLRALLRGTALQAPLRGLMRPSFVFLRERDLGQARRFMATGIPMVPVLDAEFGLVDVITLQDVLAQAE